MHTHISTGLHVRCACSMRSILRRSHATHTHTHAQPLSMHRPNMYLHAGKHASRLTFLRQTGVLPSIVLWTHPDVVPNSRAPSKTLTARVAAYAGAKVGTREMRVLVRCVHLPLHAVTSGCPAFHNYSPLLTCRGGCPSCSCLARGCLFRTLLLSCLAGWIWGLPRGVDAV
jgi:hypothetical protein